MDAKKTPNTIPGPAKPVSVSFDMLEALERAEGKTKATKSGELDPGVDKTKYATLQQAAAMLDRSVYRVRQMEWEGQFKDVKRGVKLVYISRDELAVKKQAQSTKVRATNTLGEKRLATRALKSLELVMAVIRQDGTIPAELKHGIMEVLTKYHAGAEEAEAKLKR
jgi:hypothetical protein